MAKRIKGRDFITPPISGKQIRILRDYRFPRGEKGFRTIRDDLTTLAEWMDHWFPLMEELVTLMVEKYGDKAGKPPATPTTL